MSQNLFDKDKKDAKYKSKNKKDEKLTILVSGKEFSEKLKKFLHLKDKIEEMKSELSMVQDYIKSIGVEEYAKLVENKKINVGSFVITSDDGTSIMVIPTKKYISIDESLAIKLRENYGDDIVTEETIFSFNNEVLMRNMDIINDLIQNCEKISDEDKKNIIEATTTYTINKDTLDKVYQIAKSSGKSVLEVLTDIQPVFQNKKC